MATMFRKDLQLKRPGLFITATDTEVGKTVVTCAIASQMRRQGAGRGRGLRVGVCKPVATGCRHEREGLVNEDAEALAHFADCRLPLDVINPVRYRSPVAPAVAAARTGVGVDFDAIRASLRQLDDWSDVLLVEGVGGLLVPLDGEPVRTVLDLITTLGYPVLVVARAGLGTLNHTTMTVRLLTGAGCRVAGLIVNGYQADPAGRLNARKDLAMATNRPWLERLTGVRVLATIPQCADGTVDAAHGRLPPALLEAVGTCDWISVCAKARRANAKRPTSFTDRDRE